VDEEDLSGPAAAERSGGTDYLQWAVARDQDRPTVVTLVGELDMAAASEVRSVLIEAVEAGEDVVVDLTDLVFVDSSGLAAFVAAHNGAARGGTSMSLRQPQDTVKRVLAITGLDKVFIIDG